MLESYSLAVDNRFNGVVQLKAGGVKVTVMVDRFPIQRGDNVVIANLPCRL